MSESPFIEACDVPEPLAHIGDEYRALPLGSVPAPLNALIGRAEIGAQQPVFFPMVFDQIIGKFATDGKLQELHGFPKGMDGAEQPGDLNWVHGIAMDGQGNLYLGDITGKRLQKFLRRP